MAGEEEVFLGKFLDNYYNLQTSCSKNSFWLYYMFTLTFCDFAFRKENMALMYVEKGENMKHSHWTVLSSTTRLSCENTFSMCIM